MLTINVVWLLVVLALVAYHYRSIAKYANVDTRLKNANKKLSAYRKANREYETAYNALLSEYNRVCWELQGYAENVALLASGEVKRHVSPVAIGETSAMPMFPLFVDSSTNPMFDDDGAIIFAGETLTEEQRKEVESKRLIQWNSGEAYSPIRPNKKIAKNGDSKQAGDNKTAKSENSQNQTDSSAKSSNGDKRELATVIVEVGQAIGDTLSESERKQIENWLSKEKTSHQPSAKYAEWLQNMRKNAKK